MGGLRGDVMGLLCGADAAELQSSERRGPASLQGTDSTSPPCLQQQDDSSSVQREDARAPPGVPLLLLHPPPKPRTSGRAEGSSRRGGPELVQHSGHGGDRAEQAFQRPGLRGHPEAAHLRRRPRAEGHNAASPETITGGDPEEAGRRSGEEEVSGGRAAEAFGRAEGTRARSRSESFDQRAPGAPRRRPQGTATDAPERTAGEAAGGGEAQRGGVLMA